MQVIKNAVISTFAMALFLSSAPAQAAKIKIVALGASHTYSKGVPRSQAYPAQLQRMLRARGINAAVSNAGINGNTTGQMLRRLGAAVRPGTRLVILQPGGNDRRKGFSMAQRSANIKRIKSRLRSRGIGVIVMPNRIFGRLRKTPSYVGHDGQHLTISGYRALASIYLRKVLSAVK